MSEKDVKSVNRLCWVMVGSPIVMWIVVLAWYFIRLLPVIPASAVKIGNVLVVVMFILSLIPFTFMRLICMIDEQRRYERKLYLEEMRKKNIDQ